MTNACFSSDTALNDCRTWNVSGNALSVGVRARVADGRWTTPLFGKPDGAKGASFNLFGREGTDGKGPEIAFQVQTSQGSFTAAFPLSKVDATAWHDLLGRYDGETLQILCDGRVMDQKPASGELVANNGPVLIGGDCEQDRPGQCFSGEMEEAALWDHALTDAEIRILSAATAASDNHARTDSAGFSKVPGTADFFGYAGAVVRDETGGRVSPHSAKPRGSLG
jgi:hypothetical protein